MTWETLETQYLEERGATTLDIPLANEAGGPLLAGEANALTVTLYSEDTATAAISGRDVLSSLGAVTPGTLALALSSDDLAMRTGREVETLTLTVSILYATSKERHLPIPVQLRRVRGATDMTP